MSTRQTAKEILEKFRHDGAKKREEMWCMFVDLRNEFDEIGRYPNSQHLMSVIPKPIVYRGPSQRLKI